MKADDELCLCFHVSWRKVIHFIRQRRVQHASQVAECFGAGTGCGWCRRQISRLLLEIQARPPVDLDLDAWLAARAPTAQAHAAGRQQYLADKESLPP
jgi:bacterioferritin-associated ferredoxin